MARIKNTDYFKKSLESITDSHPTVNLGNRSHIDSSNTIIPRTVQLSLELLQAVKTASVKLNEIGFSGLANDMAGLYKLAINKKFTVAFVGEFSRGKSTLINHILRNDILPVSNLPTTAVLTRIIYGDRPLMTICDKDGKKIKELPVCLDSWKGLMAANLGEQDPEGSVIIEYPDKWIGEYAIDLIDTPGVGDLEEKRAMVIERTMVSADAAIIAIDATKALSRTEQLFIQQKIMSRGVPFVALAITKLDLVKPNERAQVLSFLIKRLETLKISMPLIIVDNNIDIPNFDSIKTANIHIGIEKLKSLVIAWMANEKRCTLMEKWLSINALAILNSAKAFLLQQKEIIDAKDIEREKLICQRNNALAEVHNRWKELRLAMESRCQICCDAFNKAVSEACESLIENLQHEVDRQLQPKDWLEKEYSYRVKRELSALSLSLDNLVAKYVTKDLNWLNSELNKQFKEIVGTEVVALMSREDFQPTVNDQAIKLNSLKDKSIKTTIVSSVLTLGAALMLGVTGGAPLILATMGVGTAANVISKMSLEKEGNCQRAEIKRLIAEQIPNVTTKASADSSTKIKIIYNDIISESHNTEAKWMTAQRSLIRSSVDNQGEVARELNSNKLATIEQLLETFI